MAVPRSGGDQVATPAPSLLRDPAYVVALLIAVVVALGFGLIVPVLPLFARDFGVGLFAVTVVVSAFAGVRLVSNLYTGGLTDRIGTRQAIGWGAIIVAVSSLATATAGGYWQLVTYRGLGGFGSALFFNALLSHVLGVVPPSQRGRAVGGLQGAFLFGISFGPSVGGLLAEPLGLRWPFVIYAGFCAAAGVVALVFLPRLGTGPVVEGVEGPDGEPIAAGRRAPQGVGQLLSAARDLCRDRTFVAALLLLAASRWAATGVRFSLVPVFGVEEVGASAAIVGFGLTLAAATHLLVVWPAGKIADGIGRKGLSVGAYLAFAVIAALLGFADTVPSFLVVLALYGFATGFSSVTPPAIVGDLVPRERIGLSIGVLNTAGDLGSVLGPLVSGALAQSFGYGAGFGASALLLALGGLVALRMRETLPARASAPC